MAGDGGHAHFVQAISAQKTSGDRNDNIVRHLGSFMTKSSNVVNFCVSEVTSVLSLEVYSTISNCPEKKHACAPCSIIPASKNSILLKSGRVKRFLYGRHFWFQLSLAAHKNQRTNSKRFHRVSFFSC